ncbi:hypothetical protein EV196_107175 [Mariniflexile fucanivorans]|uniref:Uncharacterized protein n=1 Tax=Mariniflexile fucanivorans TaxID=264023 RepID=A0A4R1REV1_9FLAO|nr:hypothetical protein [Mariniflexile fucanivorans]TCL64468.1 hypothetical protein EV196_107175 [Mariniflexile fucanivorans]
MSSINKFKIGEIVTFKTHPLLYDLEIRGDGKLVPPFMVVKEVYFEDNKKKVVDSSNGKTIAEKTKYTCVFFDDNKSEFKEVVVYESMLRNYTNFFIARIDGKKPVYKIDDNDKISLITEVSNYKNAKYLYGNIIYFKTKKLEILKKRSSIKKIIINKKEENRKTIEHVVNYSTPEFVLCGYKQELGEDLFYPNGDNKKIISKELYKVKWFNSNQMKFSEQYLPMECFIDEQPFTTLVPHNENK